MLFTLLPGETSVATLGEVVVTQYRVIGPSSSRRGSRAAILLEDVVFCSFARKSSPRWFAILSMAAVLCGLIASFKLQDSASGWVGLVIAGVLLICDRVEPAGVLVIRAPSGAIEQRITTVDDGVDEFVNCIESARMDKVLTRNVVNAL